MTAVSLSIDHETLGRAFRIAKGDIAGNIEPWARKPGDAALCILAGLDYDRPWTRDAAINVWNCMAVCDPVTSKNTLCSVLVENGTKIGGQYWDVVIWAIGADAYLRATGDAEFEETAATVLATSLGFYESTEFDRDRGLFRGPAVYGDGVAAYPDRYARTGGSGSILEWPNHNPVTGAGVGIPMHALSTNCAYLRAYEVAADLAVRRGDGRAEIFAEAASRLRERIRTEFLRSEESRLRYLVDDEGGSDAQEGIGLALAALFGVLTEAEAARCLSAAVVEPAGIPCVYPTFERYGDRRGERFGRHSGTVWPHVQAMYAYACARAGLRRRWEHELFTLAEHAVRDGQFVEVYHPKTGVPYGGVQERDGDVHAVWKSCERQTWSATGFIGMILRCVIGVELERDSLSITPRLPDGVSRLCIRGLAIRGRAVRISLSGPAGSDGPKRSIQHHQLDDEITVEW